MKRFHGSRLPSSVFRLAFFSPAPMLPCSHALLFLLLLCTPVTVHAQWEPDVRLTYNDSLSGTSFNNAWCVAATGDTVHIVWYDHRDGNREIYTKRSLDGGATWGADTRLTNTSAWSSFPTVAASGSTLHVIWVEGTRVYTKRSTDGGSTWGPDTMLTNNGSWSSPSVAASGSDVHVVWNYNLTGNPQIYTKRSTDGGTTWDPDLGLTPTNIYTWSPSVAASRSNVHVVWREDLAPPNNEIYTKRSTDRGATWDPDLRLTYNSAGSVFPSVAASDSNVYIVWEEGRDGNFEIYIKRSTDGGTSWDPDTRLTNDSARTESPSVAASSSNVHVVWQDTRDGNFEIYAKRSTDWGSTWGPDTRLTVNDSFSWYPSVAASGSRVHVVWMDERDGNWEIYYKRNPTGNVGIEDNTRVVGPRIQGVKVIPNPFTFFATLPGHERERFNLYDVSGRRVGTYKGDRIGEGLSAGVYFLKPECGDAKPLRIVKLR